MSLIKCKECGREISSQATSCPNCGCPVTPPLQNTPLQSNPSAIVYPQTSKKKTSNSITVIFAVLIFVSILVFIISNIMKNPEAYKKQSIIEKEMKLTKEQDIYRTITQTEIKKLLNHPDTAQFRGISAWNFKVEDGIVIVQSSVTAQNSFGVKDTIDFQLKFDNKEIISLIMGDTEYIN